MIRIFTNNRELVLKRDTTMTVELNNALFASPDIEGDISFSFTLPVEGNEIALDFAHLPQTGGYKRLPCQVWYDGAANWSGELVVQKSDHDTITAALVINPYPDGFGKRKLTGNKDGEVVISSSIESHDSGWEAFVLATLTDPDIKLAPFINEDGYGSENEDFGYWNGQRRTNVVNALFFTGAGAFIDGIRNPFSKMHNAILDVSVFDGMDTDGNPTYNEYTETNQLAFCPQIRLARIFEIWCRNAGYAFVNHLGDDLNATFLQSQKSLDGTAAQYQLPEDTAVAETAGITDWGGGEFHYILKDIGSGAGVEQECIKPQSLGWWEIEMTPKFTREEVLEIIKREVLEAQFTWGYYGNVIQDFGIKMAIYTGNVNLQLMTETNAIKILNESLNPSPKVLRTRVAVSEDMIINGLKFVCFIKTKHGANNYGFKAIGVQWEIRLKQLSADSVQHGFNIFRSRFRIPELLPDVTNASFLKTMLDTMGLCYFISGKTRTVELLPYALLRNAKSLDLTAYELTRETEIQDTEETMRTFRLKPLKDEEFNNDLRLEDVVTVLPNPYANHEHYVLRTKTNTLYHAAKQENEAENWVEGWEEYSGNPDRIKVGAGNEENREPAVAIPHQRFFNTNTRHPDTDILTGERPQLMVAGFTICSDLYNTSETPSDIILTQYRGLRVRRDGERGVEIQNEVMLPVLAGGFSLTAKGRNSLGEKYVKPVLELLGHRTIIYKFRLPVSMMQPVEDLLRPSELDPGLQTRFLIVRNVKTVPKKITIQIDNDRDDTVLCQIEAVKVY